MYSSKESSWSIETGLHEIVLYYKWELVSPVDVSPGKNKASFWALYPNEKGNEVQLWICILDFDTRKVDKIIPISTLMRHDTKRLYDREYKTHMKWCPNPKLPLIFVTSYQDGGTILINWKEKKIVKKIPKTPESIRWSPDGTKLALLWMKELWIYDVEKDSLKMIDKDDDYFDFFWVKKD